MIVLLCLLTGCNRKNYKKTEEIIIKDNIDLFMSNLYGLPSKDAPIFIIKKIGNNDFIVDHCESIIEMEGSNLIGDCKKELFELINKEGFNINKNTKYASFEIQKFRNNQNIKIVNNNTDIKENEYVEVTFSNFFIDKKKGKGFVIVQESDVTKKRIGGKVDIYFFENQNSKWVHLKTKMLITS